MIRKGDTFEDTNGERYEALSRYDEDRRLGSGHYDRGWLGRALSDGLVSRGELYSVPDIRIVGPVEQPRRRLSLEVDRQPGHRRMLDEAALVQELRLYALTSSEPLYRMMLQGAQAIAKAAIRADHYDEDRAMRVAVRIALEVPKHYMRDIGATETVRSGRLSRAEQIELAQLLLHDWIIPHIKVDLRPEIESKYGRLPPGLR